MNIRYIYLSFLTLALALLVCASCARADERQKTHTDAVSDAQCAAPSALGHSPADTAILPAEDDSITLSFVGDCMLASEYYAPGWNSFAEFARSREPEYFFSRVSDMFLADDFTIANCENVFTERALPPCEKDYTPAYWYKSDTVNAGIFASGGVDIVSCANNHTLDFGADGMSDTAAALENAGILWGDTSHPLMLEKNGTRIALYCTTISNGGYIKHIADWYDSVKDESEFQIVFFHGGIEMTYAPSAAIQTACRSIADMGVDVIIGHHPHVLQPMEHYNGAVIVYSLGNFLFGGGRPENRTVIMQLSLYPDGESAVELLPAYCYGEDWQPCLITDEGERAAVLDFMNGLREAPT
ncbi:MAG: CapA family protein [Eubacteriales bacterium]